MHGTAVDGDHVPGIPARSVFRVILHPRACLLASWAHDVHDPALGSILVMNACGGSTSMTPLPPSMDSCSTKTIPHRVAFCLLWRPHRSSRPNVSAEAQIFGSVPPWKPAALASLRIPLTGRPQWSPSATVSKASRDSKVISWRKGGLDG